MTISPVARAHGLHLAGATRTRGPSLSTTLQPTPSTRHPAETHSAPLKVLFCTDNFGVGGTELNAVRTAERLVRRGIPLEVAALQAAGPLRSRYDALGIPVHAFPVPNLYGPRAVQQGLRFARLIRRGGFDVVHAHDIYSNIFSGIWGRVGGARALVASRRWGADSTQGRLSRLNALAQRHAAMVLANSAAVATLAHQEGAASDRVAVIPNFLEPDAFAPPMDRATWRGSLGIPAEAWVVGIVARLSPVKDHATLLAAWREVRAAISGAHLAIIGDGPLRAELEQHAAALGPSVTFCGELPNRPNLHGLFDVSVLTSVSEGFPNTLAEAMAAGRPVVATAVGGVPDVVLNGRTGLLVPARAPERLAAALIQLGRDPDQAAVLGSAGASSARDRFAEESVISDLLRLYRRAAR